MCLLTLDALLFPTSGCCLGSKTHYFSYGPPIGRLGRIFRTFASTSSAAVPGFIWSTNCFRCCFYLFLRCFLNFSCFLCVKNVLKGHFPTRACVFFTTILHFTHTCMLLYTSSCVKKLMPLLYNVFLTTLISTRVLVHTTITQQPVWPFAHLKTVYGPPLGRFLTLPTHKPPY